MFYINVYFLTHVRYVKRYIIYIYGICADITHFGCWEDANWAICMNAFCNCTQYKCVYLHYGNAVLN